MRADCNFNKSLHWTTHVAIVALNTVDLGFFAHLFSLRRDLQHRATDFSNQTCCEMDPIDLGAAPRCHAGHHACEIREHRGRRYELALEVVVVRTM